MKEKKQVNSYRAPECQLVPVETSYLMETSFPGQHRPGHHGTGPSSAKAFVGWDDEENPAEDGENSQSWEE